MGNKVTVKTLWNVLNEVEYGAKDKSRTIDSIRDEQVKEIISSGAGIGIKTGIVGAAAAGAGAAFFSAGAGGAAAAFTGGAAAVAGATAGAVGGSVVPVIGTLIGLGVGLGVGALVGWKTKRKNENEKQRLYQEVMAKQNGVIKQLEDELEKLKENNHRTQEQNKRYEYIIGILTATKHIGDTLSGRDAA